MGNVPDEILVRKVGKTNNSMLVASCRYDTLPKWLCEPTMTFDLFISFPLVFFLMFEVYFHFWRVHRMDVLGAGLVQFKIGKLTIRNNDLCNLLPRVL